MPAWRLAAYGLPAVPLAAIGVPLFIYLPTFYARDLGLGFAGVGAVLLAARLWDMVSDPLVGVLSDRIASRFGRRRPWLIAGTPPTLVATAMLLLPSGPVDLPYLAIWAFVLYLGWTMLTVPYQAWGAELSDDYHERTRIASFREGGILLGTLLATTLPAVAGAAALDSAAPQTLPLLAGLVIAVLPPAVLLAVALVPDRAAAPPRIGWRHGWAVLAGNRPFRRLLIAYLANGTANGFPATLFVLFVGHVLQAPALVPALLCAYFVAGLLGVPLWLAVSYRLGKHRTWCVAMLMVTVVFAGVPLLGPGDVAAFLAICVLSGLGLGADLVLPTAMQADVVDLDTRQTGRRRTGLYFAIWGMATKLALALAVGLAFPLLAVSGFSADAAAPPAVALTLLYGLLPLPFKLLAVWLIWRFPVDAAPQRGLRQPISGRSADAASAT